MTLTDTGLARIRARAERELVDRVTVTRPGTPTTNPGSLEIDDNATTIHRSLPALVTTARGSDTETGEHGRRPRTTDDYRARIPIGASIARGDQLTVTASTDPHMVGLVFTVTTSTPSSQASTRRLALELHTDTRRR